MAKLVLLLVFVCFQFSRPEELPAVEQIKLDLDEDEIPFNNQTAPESTEVLDGADEDQWSPGPKFNYDWLNESFSDKEVASNKTKNNALSILEELIALAEMIAGDSDEDDSFEWGDDLYDDDEDDDYSYWDKLTDWSYSAQYKESLKNKNGKEYVYNSIISLLKPKKGEVHPVKRFTSV